MAGGHVYVTACGFGKRVVPASSPFEFRLEPDGALVVTLDGKRTIVTTAHSPAESLSSNGAVADVIVGPQGNAWWIDTGSFRIPFPLGWTVFANGGVAPPFYLEGSLERTVFIQTANNVPTGDDLVASYQSVVDRSSVGPYESLELAYQHEGRAWLQRHTVLTRQGKPCAVLTAQAPLEAFAGTRELQLSIANNIVFA